MCKMWNGWGRSLATIVCAASLSAPSGAEAKSFSLPRSAVVAMVHLPSEIYEAARVDFVAWVHRPAPGQVAAARAGGTELGGAIGTRTASGAFIKSSTPAEREAAICRRCDGTPVLVPGLEKAVYEGLPAYWFSVTSPAFRRLEKHYVNMVLGSGSKTLLVDDPIGGLAAHNEFGGCYSEFDVAALRRLYVERIAGASAANFNLCSFHAKSVLPNTPEHRLAVEHFVGSALENVRELKAAIAERGLDLSVTGNISIDSSYAGPFLSEFDFFTFETSYGREPEKLNAFASIYALKLGDHLGKPTILMGHGGNHRYVAEHKAMTLLRAWIARSYAFGGYFVVPEGVWMNRPVNGSDRLSLDAAEYVPLYRFIKDHKGLFDGHDEVARVAILHDVRSLDTESVFDRAFLKTQSYRYAEDLLNQGIPFSIIPIVTDADLDKAVAALDGRYDFLLAPRQMSSALGARAGTSGKVLYDTAELPASYAVSARQDGLRLQTSLRRTSDGRFTLHVMNLAYDRSGDAVRPTGKVEIRVPKRYLGKPVTQADVYAFDAKGQAPAGVPAPAALQDDGADVVVTLDTVGLWSLVTF
ncbi:hypothetical protein [Xanthobacter wiegelii]|uniref:hypothetical protein n=1 Tax=Xanthobacter wiegelii TaxID=3119913 RepID=UPI0037298B5D